MNRDVFVDIITRRIAQEVEERVAAAAEKAAKEARDAVRSAAAKIALDVLAQYDIEYQRDTLTIRVREVKL